MRSSALSLTTALKKQIGYRKARFCFFNVFALKQLIQKNRKIQFAVEFSFRDYKKTDVSVNRDKLSGTMLKWCYARYLVKLIACF